VSGVAVAPVPLSNYAVDVNIPSGLGASIDENLDAVVQGLLVTPVWTALVWLVHVVVIALEWCYSLDLLAPATLARVSASLGAAKRVFTDPWLGLGLALAAVSFAWQGLVRRRVLDTLGRAALLALMVTGGLWIIANPIGTVGAVGNLADQAALATVAAAATGDPARPVASVDGAFAVVFDAAVGGPWCYLEFGDVAWCRDPAALDRRLRAVANRFEQLYRAAARCRGPAPGLVQCAPAGSSLQTQLAATATSLEEAHTNGALFLALPAGTVGRTALTSPTSTPTLYQTLCGSSNATACTAPTALQAEFRTAAATWPRVGGLVLIVAGCLGMLLLFGFIAMRLLGAALATLLYLLLAPLAVLAPALGDAGRDTFRLWLTRLVGSLVAKLVYSVALGVVLMVVTLLGSLDQLGWWTQWLLVSVFWWIAFEHRHRLLSLVLHERGEPARRAPLATRTWLAGRTAGAGVGAIRASGRAVFRAGARAAEIVDRRRRFPSDAGGGSGTPPARELAAGAVRAHMRAGALAELRAQVDRMASIDRDAAPHARLDATRSARVPVALAARAARLDSALIAARAGGDRRRVVSLEARRARVEAERTAEAGERRSPVVPGGIRRAFASRARARALDRATRAPAGAVLRERVPAAPLAGLVGIRPADYLRATPAERRAARVAIERQLRRRRELLDQARPAPTRLLRSVLAADPAPTGPSAAAESAAARRRRQFGPGST
jgi:hypothetical protein